MERLEPSLPQDSRGKVRGLTCAGADGRRASLFPLAVARRPRLSANVRPDVARRGDTKRRLILGFREIDRAVYRSRDGSLQTTLVHPDGVLVGNGIAAVDLARRHGLGHEQSPFASSGVFRNRVFLGLACDATAVVATHRQGSLATQAAQAKERGRESLSLSVHLEPPLDEGFSSIKANATVSVATRTTKPPIVVARSGFHRHLVRLQVGRRCRTRPSCVGHSAETICRRRSVWNVVNRRSYSRRHSNRRGSDRHNGVARVAQGRSKPADATCLSVQCVRMERHCCPMATAVSCRSIPTEQSGRPRLGLHSRLFATFSASRIWRNWSVAYKEVCFRLGLAVNPLAIAERRDRRPNRRLQPTAADAMSRRG